MTPTRVEVTFTGATTGLGWWPRAQLAKPLHRMMVRSASDDELTLQDEAVSLREMAERILMDEDGDYSTVGQFTGDTWITISRIKPGRVGSTVKRTRVYEASSCASIRDLVTDSWVGSDFFGEDY